MLLDIMSLAGNVRSSNPASTQPHFHCLARCRVWLLRFRSANFQTYAFEHWHVGRAEGWRDGFANVGLNRGHYLRCDRQRESGLVILDCITSIPKAKD
jgi:hypothetical protein